MRWWPRSPDDAILAHAWLAQAHDRQEDAVEAVRHARHALIGQRPLEPDTTVALLGILTRSPDRAMALDAATALVDVHRELLRRHPDTPESLPGLSVSLDNVAGVQQRWGQLDEALAAWTRATALRSPTPMSWLRCGTPSRASRRKTQLLDRTALHGANGTVTASDAVTVPFTASSLGSPFWCSGRHPVSRNAPERRSPPQFLTRVSRRMRCAGSSRVPRGPVPRPRAGSGIPARPLTPRSSART